MQIYQILDYMKNHYTREDGLYVALRRYLLKEKTFEPKNISMFCLDIASKIEANGCKYILEENIDVYEVDIIVENQDGKRILIEAQGYQHFFRNEEVQRGNTHLKRSLLKG